ncbi:MAG: fumarylacetoacetase, partial [Campylobacter sp.]|nr:fumarylacetoacetase [Campylobacter sp.]
MKFLNFILNNEPCLGVLNSKQEVVCLKDLGIEARDMNEFIIHYEKYRLGLENLEKAPSFVVPKEKILAP